MWYFVPLLCFEAFLPMEHALLDTNTEEGRHAVLHKRTWNNDAFEDLSNTINFIQVDITILKNVLFDHTVQ